MEGSVSPRNACCIAKKSAKKSSKDGKPGANTFDFAIAAFQPVVGHLSKRETPRLKALHPLMLDGQPIAPKICHGNGNVDIFHLM